MCLRLLRAEIWSVEIHRRLQRVTARLIPNEVRDDPMVIAHGRIVVLGGDNQRLHEEIITAGGVLRHGRFARLNVGEIRDALEAALPEPPPQGMQRRLAELWPDHCDPLLASLEARMRDRAAGLQRTLEERAAKEAADVRAILTELHRSILAELRQPEIRQLELFKSSEREQLERNRDSLRARADRIPAEIEQEIGAIQARYAGLTPRLFPVAVTYLVPERLARCAGGGH